MTINSERRSYKKGEFVFRRSEPATELYTIVSGEVRLFGTQRGKDVTVSILEPGTFFGEMALSGDHPRVVSAQATADSILSVIRPEALKELVTEPLVWQVIQRMGDRINDVEQQFEKLRAKDELRLVHLGQLLQWRSKEGSGVRPF